MIKGGSQSGRKVVTHDSKSDLPLPKTNAGLDAANMYVIGWSKISLPFKINGDAKYMITQRPF